MSLLRRGPTDIVLAGVPMMLVRGKGGVLEWNEEPVPFVPERVLDGDMTYASLPPDEAATFAQHRFDGGIGRRTQPDVEAGEILYLYPGNVTGDGVLISAPLVTSIVLPVTCSVADFFEQGTDFFAVGGRYCLKKGAGDTFSTEKDFGVTQTAQAAEVFAGVQATEYAFVALGSTTASEPFWVRDAAGVWTQHGSKKADYVRRYRSELWRAFLDATTNGQTVEKSSDGGTASTWAAPTIVGDGGGQITGLEILDDSLLVARSDGLFEVTKDTTPDDADLLGGFVKSRRNANNGRKTFSWKDLLFYPMNDGGLYCRMADGATFEMGITFIPTNRTPIRGRCTALAGDDYWLYATWFNPLTNESYLCKARVVGYTDSGRPQFAWVGALVVWTGGVTVGAMRISGVGGLNPHLYMGRSDSRVDHIALPRNGTDAMHDAEDGGECRARATTLVYLTEFTGRFLNWTKDYEADRCEVENTSPGARYVDEEYRTSDAAAWASLGRFETDGQASLEFGNVNGKRLQRRLTLITNDPAEFVAIRSVVLDYALRPPDKQRFTFTVDATYAGDRRVGGGLQRDDPEDVVTTIRSCRAAAGSVVLVGPNLQQHEVRVTSYRKVNTAAESDQPLAWGVLVSAVAKAETADLAIYDVNSYDDGSVYA